MNLENVLNIGVKIDKLKKQYFNKVLVDQLLHIYKECNQFIIESQNNPIYKHFEKTDTIIKIKARKRLNKSDSVFSDAFDYKDLQQRSVNTYTTNVSQDNKNSYYIFIPNGYDFIYNPNVINSDIYQTVEKSLNPTVLTNIIKQQYQTTDLHQAFNHSTEILFYNVSYFYGINTRAVTSYQQLLQIMGVC